MPDGFINFAGMLPFKTKTILPCLVFLLLGLSLFSQSNTNLGTDFWIAFPPNSSVSAVKQLYLSSAVSTSGTITSVFPGVNQNFTVTPGVVTMITLPEAITLQGGTEGKGIHITALDPVAVYGLNNQTASTDAFLALPTTALGADYRILTYQTTVNGSGSSFSVVATQDGTQLTIFNRQTGMVTFEFLNAGQTYHESSSGLNEDLTGSRIQSNHPIAVFGSVKIGQITQGCTFADHMVEQLFPEYSWGKNYITVPFAGRDNSGDIFRILAGDDGTAVTINGVPVATLNAGEFHEVNLPGYNVISCSKASLVAQFAKGQNCSGGTLGDPLMMLVLPKEQFLTDYTIINVAGVTPFNSHWLNLVAPDYAVGTIYLDGGLIPPATFIQIGTSGYYGAQIPVDQGTHTLNSIHPFGLSVYGWRTVDSYGYPGGGSMSPVATVDSLSLTPDTLYGELNITSLCLTARVLNSLNNPVEGVLVNFYVTGINPLTGNAYTNALGEAQYCYTQTGIASGIDHVYAEAFAISSDTSVVFWSYQCENPADGGTVGEAQTGCSILNAQDLYNITLPSGYAGTLEYLWQQSVISGSSGFMDVAGSNTPGYSPGTLSQTTWYRRLSRVSCKSDWSEAALSNVIELKLIPELPVAVTVTASEQQVCAGTPVTFTATPVNGGASPVFQWLVNGMNAGTNSPVFSYSPGSGDWITCTMTSSETCTSGNPATGNPISVIVNPLLPVSVSITASANPVCSGLPVIFTATPVNGGINPAYQWKVNGNNVGLNQPSCAFIPLNGDSVYCILTSSEQCTSGNPASSILHEVSLLETPAVTFTPCFDTITTTNAKPIKLKGGIPLGGTYSGPGVSGGYFYPNVAGAGSHIITYSYTNAALCEANASLSIINYQLSIINCGQPYTDIRDGTTYPTVQIGSQCWMASNLSYGSLISGSQSQRDNCLPEKYCYNDAPAPCALSPVLYQWDEVMQYDDTPGLQGLCPPGWHVPAEAEWQTLFSNWTNQGFAGAALKYSGYSGFNALLSGVNHLNRQWSFGDFATFFWSSSPYGPHKAWSHGMNDYDPSVSSYPSVRTNAFSVRCLRD